MSADDDRLYRYFVSYAHADGFGNTQINSPRPITTFDDVTAAARAISEMRGYDVLILNYQLLSGPDPS